MTAALRPLSHLFSNVIIVLFKSKIYIGFITKIKKFSKITVIINAPNGRRKENKFLHNVTTYVI